MSDTLKQALPPLPRAGLLRGRDLDSFMVYYTADQMLDYALAAIESVKGEQAAQPPTMGDDIVARQLWYEDGEIRSKNITRREMYIDPSSEQAEQDRKDAERYRGLRLITCKETGVTEQFFDAEIDAAIGNKQ